MHISDAAKKSTCRHTSVPEKQFPTPEFQKPPALGHYALEPRSNPAPTSPRNARLDLSSALPGVGRTASPGAASGSSAIGALTDEVHAELARHWPSRYVHFDASAFVLSTIPSSEDRQKKLIRMTIDSAERFAILTSFSVNPTKDHEPGQVSATTFAMLESLAKKQHDSHFKFVFLYNDNKLQRNAVVSAIVGQNVTANMSLKSNSHVPGTITWPAVVETYNRQQRIEELRIGHVKCGIYFVAAKAEGRRRVSSQQILYQRPRGGRDAGRQHCQQDQGRVDGRRLHRHQRRTGIQSTSLFPG
ncbi:hypothetical protein AVMA1855_17760 [Acidovorax sp. SUPP1855]|uniref:hypothetical protein n=1 Tax=Acidovorax sp. SUPP1855 TaxID=431774 RepID=UPI0023DE38F3|nr:hypothetical protein [Acidovorax sp. SUPP1855]GKS86026.1 hypothetical protein AVMA1855_17760 [Acidovorax sp. SUPP1855]